MKFWDALIIAVAEQRGFHVSQTPPAWVEALTGSKTASGVVVNESSAMEASAVYGCVRILSETLASLPLLLYRRDGSRKERVTDHPLYELLHTLPNPEMSSFELRETLMGHLLTWGNAYAEIEFNRAGQVRGLWPLRPDRMTVRREGGRLWYTYRLNKPDGQGRQEVTLPAEQVWHIRGLGFDGVMGYSPIGMARQAVGLSLAMEEFGARFFGNGARPGGILEHPGKLGDPAYERLQKSWQERHGGLENASRTAILEEGMKYHEIGIPPEDAQFLESRKFQVSEIARIYRVPPHMLADLDRATFSNIEHQSIEFVVFTMQPWFVRWEQSIARSLLTPAERSSLFAEFLVSGLLRGDTQSRYQAYAVARQNGWMSANDVRELENMNPIQGGGVYLVPLNMVPADQVGTADYADSAEDGNEDQASDVKRQAAGLQGNWVLRSAKADAEERGVRSARSRHRLEMAERRVYRDILGRVLRRERHDVGEAVKKLLGARSQADFQMWIDEFYGEHGRFVFEQLRPAAWAYGELVAAAAQEEVDEPEGLTPDIEVFMRGYLAAFAARHEHLDKIGRAHV